MSYLNKKHQMVSSVELAVGLEVAHILKSSSMLYVCPPQPRLQTVQLGYDKPSVPLAAVSDLDALYNLEIWNSNDPMTGQGPGGNYCSIEEM